MKVLLVGAGSVGGVLAVMMKKNGFDTDLLSSNENSAKHYRENGIHIDGKLGEFHQKFNAFGNPEELNEKYYDVCIIATKYQQLKDAAKSVLSKVKDDGLFCSVQNGLSYDTLSEIVGKNRTVGVMIGFGATLNSIGNVTVTSKGEFYVGMADNTLPPKLYFVRDLFNTVLPTRTTTDIRSRLWSKLIINTCINSVCAITGETLGEILKQERVKKLFLAVARECYATARALGIDVPKYGKVLDYRLLVLSNGDFYNKICGLVIGMVGKGPYGLVKPSTLQSLEKGQKTEIDIFNGYIVKMAGTVGVECPVNEKLTTMIKQIEEGERKISLANLDEFEF